MKTFAIVLLALVALAAADDDAVQGNALLDLLNTDEPPVRPETTTLTPTPAVVTDAPAKRKTTTTMEPTTAKPTSPPTTAAPLTTEAKPETTAAPVVTTAAPAVVTTGELTTAAPITTEAPLTTAPPAPAPNTTLAPTPTPAPTPKPTPKPKLAVGNYSTDCIRVSMAAQFNISADQKVDVPATATVAGTCNNATAQQTLQLTWGENELSLTFDKKDKKISVSKIVLKYGATVDVLTNMSLFTAVQGNSYLCISAQDLYLQPHNTQLHLENLHVQAFGKDMTSNATAFGTPQECPADSATPNIVPIAVGAALAVLVVIVLVAYLISRHRNAGGYESV